MYTQSCDLPLIFYYPFVAARKVGPPPKQIFLDASSDESSPALRLNLLYYVKISGEPPS
jgi:hypothetical protein